MREQPSPAALVAEDQAPVLEIDDLAISFGAGPNALNVVRSASLRVRTHEAVGLVGESGSGKTLTALAALGLVPIVGGRVMRGRVSFQGQDLTQASQRQWQDIRGARISMIFQQPIRSLNPALTVGEQIAESLRRHTGATRHEARAQTVELLNRVQIARAEQRVSDYPHQFSGGMCQRVMIAMALACKPDLIIADEPTTALDATVQAKILNLLREVTEQSGASLLYISHDLAVVSELCTHITVMYAGETVESGEASSVFHAPRHPYTSGLIGCVPRNLGVGDRLASIPGTVPPADQMPAGCRFHPRCGYATAGKCDTGTPDLVEFIPGRSSRCVRHDELTLEGSA